MAADEVHIIDLNYTKQNNPIRVVQPPPIVFRQQQSSQNHIGMMFLGATLATAAFVSKVGQVRVPQTNIKAKPLNVQQPQVSRMEVPPVRIEPLKIKARDIAPKMRSMKLPPSARQKQPRSILNKSRSEAYKTAEENRQIRQMDRKIRDFDKQEGITPEDYDPAKLNEIKTLDKPKRLKLIRKARLDDVENDLENPINKITQRTKGEQ